MYNGGHGYDLMTMKLASSDGDIVWTRFASGAGEYEDRGWAVVVGSDGHPVVTGITDNGDGTANFFTRKLDNADGSTIWTRIYPGAPTNIEERAGWLVVCDNDDVVMANRTWSSGTSYDVVLHRYAAADGEPVWLTQYGGEGTSSDNPRHMTRDQSGDILVAGVQSGNYLALKFDGDSGDLVWPAIFDGPTAGYDAANRVAEGSSGEVIVTGFTTGDGTSWDASTVAFSPLNGDLLWQAHFDSGEGQPEEGSVLAVSPLGDVYTVGYGYTLATESDLLSIRYHVESTNAVIDIIADPLLLRAAPNPFSHQVIFSLEMLSLDRVEVRVHDVTGRRIARLHDGILDRGMHRIAWDGRDDNGNRLGPGIYLVRVEGSEIRQSGKVIRLQ